MSSLLSVWASVVKILHGLFCRLHRYTTNDWINVFDQSFDSLKNINLLNETIERVIETFTEPNLSTILFYSGMKKLSDLLNPSRKRFVQQYGFMHQQNKGTSHWIIHWSDSFNNTVLFRNETIWESHWIICSTDSFNNLIQQELRKGSD